MSDHQKLLAQQMSEAEVQRNTIDMARTLGWQCAHFRPGMTSRLRRNKDGALVPVWVTPVQGDGKGFPDLIAVRARRGLAIEFKREGQNATPEQNEWLIAFHWAGFESYTWRPSDWLNGTIEEALGNGQSTR